MKDGTELTHYGVKGMKWGKRLFGKVKGVFGKPKPVRDYGKTISDKQINDVYKSQNNKIETVLNKKNATNAEFHRAVTIAENYDRMLKNRKKKYESSGSDFYAAREKKAANTIKRNSKRINGR